MLIITDEITIRSGLDLPFPNSRFITNSKRRVANFKFAKTPEIYGSKVVGSNFFCMEQDENEKSFQATPLAFDCDVIPMPASQTIAVRYFLASLMGLIGLAFVGTEQCRAADEVRQPIAIRFSFDRPIDASVAPFVLA